MDEHGNKGLIPEPYVKKVCIAVTCCAILCSRNLSWKFLTDPINQWQNSSEYFMCAFQWQSTSPLYCRAWNHLCFSISFWQAFGTEKTVWSTIWCKIVSLRNTVACIHSAWCTKKILDTCADQSVFFDFQLVDLQLQQQPASLAQSTVLSNLGNDQRRSMPPPTTTTPDNTTRRTSVPPNIRPHPSVLFVFVWLSISVSYNQ